MVDRLVRQVRVHHHRLEIECDAAAIATALQLEPAEHGARVTLTAAVTLTRTGRTMQLVHDNGQVAAPAANRSLVRLLVRARRWWAILRAGGVDIKRLAAAEGVQAAYVTRVVRLAFLSPAVTDAILAGRQSDNATVTELTLGSGVDPYWARQKLRLIAGVAA